MRLNKYIAHSGLASRRKADDLVFNGNVKINGVTCKEPGYDVEEGDVVEVMETRPLSKDKRWRLVTIIETAQ